MYRDGKVYDKIKDVIIDIFIDYDIKEFPINEREVCKKLGVALVAYSEYEGIERELLLKKSKYGFFAPPTSNNVPTIFYNDINRSYGMVRFTIFHELKHYVFEDQDDEDDDIADFFVRYFMCPIPYMLLKKIDSQNEIMSYCGMSLEPARYACSNIINRRNRYGYKIFDYEVRLINHLNPILLEVYKKSS